MSAITNSLINQVILIAQDSTKKLGIEMNNEIGIQDEELIPDLNNDNQQDLSEILDYIVNHVQSKPLITQVADIVNNSANVNEVLNLAGKQVPVSEIKMTTAGTIYSVVLAEDSEVVLTNNRVVTVPKNTKLNISPENKAYSTVEIPFVGTIPLILFDKQVLISSILLDNDGLVKAVKLTENTELVLANDQTALVKSSSASDNSTYVNAAGKVTSAALVKPIEIVLAGAEKPIKVEYIHMTDTGIPTAMTPYWYANVTLITGQTILASPYRFYNITPEGKVYGNDLCVANLKVSIGDKPVRVSELTIDENALISKIVLVRNTELVLTNDQKATVAKETTLYVTPEGKIYDHNYQGIPLIKPITLTIDNQQVTVTHISLTETGEITMIGLTSDSKMISTNSNLKVLNSNQIDKNFGTERSSSNVYLGVFPMSLDAEFYTSPKGTYPLLLGVGGSIGQWGSYPPSNPESKWCGGIKLLTGVNLASFQSATDPSLLLNIDLLAQTSLLYETKLCASTDQDGFYSTEYRDSLGLYVGGKVAVNAVINNKFDIKFNLGADLLLAETPSIYPFNIEIDGALRLTYKPTSLFGIYVGLGTGTGNTKGLVGICLTESH